MTWWYRKFKIALSAAFVAVSLLAVACGDEGRQPAGSTPPARTPAEAAFPVILEHDTRVIAAADGSDIREEAVRFERRTPSAAYEGLASPDGSLLVTFRDGTLYVQEGDGEPEAIAEVPSTEEFASIGWSPDGSRLVFDVSFDGSSASLYIVNVNGSGLVDVGQGLEGDAYVPEGWSPDGERLAFGVSVFPSNGQTGAGGVLSQMYVVNADGSNRAAVGEFVQPQGDAGWDAPAWSPDGSSIVAFSPEGGVRILRASGEEPLDLGVSDTLKWSWSPDSRYLAFDDGYQPSVVRIADVTQAGTVRELTSGFWPRWSPDGARVAFKRNGAVFTIRADGSGLASIGSFGSNDRGELTWAADSTEVEFVRGASAVEYVYAVNLRTASAVRSPRSLTESGFPGVGSFIELSPDGTRVAFSTNEEEDVPTPGWFVMDVQSGDVMQVSSDARPGDLFWSEQGARIALSGGSNGVFVAESDGSPPHEVSTSESGTAMAWSPDGSYLAFGTRGGIELVEVDGPDDRRLVSGLDPQSEIVQDVEWSPDGNALLYELSRSTITGATEETFVVASDGGQARLLVQSGSSRSFAGWSPDGRTVAVVRTDESGTELRLIDADGSNERLLTRFEGRYSTLELRTAGGGPAAWSPGGTKIAAVLNGTDLYVIDSSTGEATFVAANASYCLMALLGWSPNSETLYVVPQCALGGI